MDREGSYSCAISNWQGEGETDQGEETRQSDCDHPIPGASLTASIGCERGGVRTRGRCGLHPLLLIGRDLRSVDVATSSGLGLAACSRVMPRWTGTREIVRQCDMAVPTPVIPGWERPYRSGITRCDSCALRTPSVGRWFGCSSRSAAFGHR